MRPGTAAIRALAASLRSAAPAAPDGRGRGRGDDRLASTPRATPRCASSRCASTASPPTPAGRPGAARGGAAGARPELREAHARRPRATSARWRAPSRSREPATAELPQGQRVEVARVAVATGRRSTCPGARSLPVVGRHVLRPGPGRRRRAGSSSPPRPTPRRRAGAAVLAAARSPGRTRSTPSAARRRSPRSPTGPSRSPRST